MKKRNKFTLIELMVVIAIIAVLASLLFPSLSKARGFAKLAVCSNQLAQMGAALALYQTDNDMTIPRPRESGKYKQLNWVGTPGEGEISRNENRYLNPYLGYESVTDVVEIARCPGDLPGGQNGKGSRFEGTDGSSYWANANNLAWQKYHSLINKVGKMNRIVDLKVAMIKKPSLVVAIGDTNGFSVLGGYSAAGKINYHKKILTDIQANNLFVDGHVQKTTVREGVYAVEGTYAYDRDSTLLD
jgi:prepilin-type N-terminal cleavage/methylation domain-containing protein/prepilin-type processing-associated H-X9-DG protein